VTQAADPQGRGRQYLASQLEKLVGTRMAGFLLTRQAPAGKWGAATYALQRTDTPECHRDHRGHRTTDAPYAPYADGGGSKNASDEIYTASRSQEVLKARWSEIDQKTAGLSGRRLPAPAAQP
jgi:hypothetical protein